MIQLLCFILPTIGSQRLFNLFQDLDALVQLERYSLSPQMQSIISEIRSESITTFSILSNLQTQLASTVMQNSQCASMLMSAKVVLKSCTENLSEAHNRREQDVAAIERSNETRMQEMENKYRSDMEDLKNTVAFYDDLLTGKEKTIDDELISSYQEQIKRQASEIEYLQSNAKSTLVLAKNIPKGTPKKIVSTVIFPEAVEIHMLPWEHGSVHGQTALVKFGDWESMRKHIEWFQYARLRRIAMDTDTYTKAGILHRISQGGVNLPFPIEEYF